MIRPGERLERIAERLNDCKTMADIGTDHGFLPVYLVENGNCEKAVAADISAMSLEKALSLCSELGVSEVELRTGDGLKVLNPGEVEGVVIAGMGGTLISEIMGADMEHTVTFEKFVLQPRTASGELRKWLIENGFIIVNEDIVREGKFLPEIITVRPPGKKLDGEMDMAHRGIDGNVDIYYDVPQWMVYAAGPVDEHIERLKGKEERILEGLLNAKEVDEELVSYKRKKIEYLEKLKETVEIGR